MPRLLGVLILLGLLFVPALSAAQSVAQVTTVTVDAAKIPEYTAAVMKLEPIMKKYAPSAKFRIWRTTIAGPASNRVSVVVEFASSEEWGKAIAQFNADPDYQKALRNFEGMGREILSVSMAVEITP